MIMNINLQLEVVPLTGRASIKVLIEREEIRDDT